jgi:hypothetical protein
MNRWLATTIIKTFIGILIAVAVIIAIVAVIRLDTTGKKGSGLGDEFIYDLKDLGKIDPKLILYEESAPPIVTAFTDSRGIAIDSKGNIYAAGDKAVRKFADNGNLLGEIILTDVPMSLAVSDDGKLYIAFKDHVQIYDGVGKRLATWQSLGNDAVLTSIAVSKNNVLVADAGNRIVYRFDKTGKLINRIGEKDKAGNIPGFIVPSPHFDLAVAPDGLLRVVNPGRHLIEAYTFEGDREFSWGKFSNVDLKGFCGCCNPVNFAILDDESFVTCEKGLTRVKIYDPDGVFVGAVAGPEQLVEEGSARICDTAAECQDSGFDVAVDSKGRIFVMDTIKNTVRIFTKIKQDSQK